MGVMSDKVEKFLNKTKKTFFYYELANKFGTNPRAIGACMKALAKKNDGKFDGNVKFVKKPAKKALKKTATKKIVAKKSAKIYAKKSA